ncbi:MAG: hypothetical protein PHI64_16915 [Zoogloea sp.]|uniref:hypothetical protein n=1 Tax=Zoogloea sp. TaxID=49181 RepID=UPI002601F297|nr:hypothetical protein [Zoogloea sp.]MDD2990625.1 hypothetical protein [Zoogloea sp.]
MTILRRIGSMTLIPGTPGKPATPGYSKLVEVPDPPSPTTLTFGGFGNYGVGIPVSTVFGKQGTVVMQGSPNTEGGNSYPPLPGAQQVQSYNGTKGEYAVITGADGSIKVVRL